MIREFSLRRDGRKQLSKNFQVYEFACKDGSDKILIDMNLIPYIQCLRDMWGPGNINSAYRHLAYNRSINSGDGSRHVVGRAVDIKYLRNGRQVPPKEVAQYMEYMGMQGVGHYNTFTHGDTGPKKRMWVNFGKEKSVPTHLTNKFKVPVTMDGEVTASVLNVREGPGLDYGVISQLPKGSKKSVDIVYEDWGKLHGEDGWISMDYLKKSDNTVGNKVKVTGRGWITAYGTGARTKFFSSQEMTVLAIHKGKAAPYQLTMDPNSKWTTGFFKEEQLDG